MLASAGARFETRFEVLEGGSGFFSGVIDEPRSQPPPTYVFTANRRILRTRLESPARPGLVARAEGGQVFILSADGTSDVDGGVFRNFRLIEATHRLPWTRRIKVVDPVTQLEKDSGATAMGDIWCAYEPENREVSGGELRTHVEAARLVAAAAVQRGDQVGGYRLVRVDTLLGVQVAITN